MIASIGKEKRYTKDHEWLELSPDGKTGTISSLFVVNGYFQQSREQVMIQLWYTDYCLTGTIGISTYAAKNLGDVVFVELPDTDTDVDVKAGDSIGAVESVKSASDILTPVTGKVIEANDVLQEKPAVINKSPEGDGWIARIEVGEAGRREHDELMDAKAYEEFTEE